MPTNRLTDHACRAAKPKDKAYKLFDGGGLFLWVSTGGAKTWRQAYRLDGKPQTASHGEYPLVTLADARGKRDELKKRLLSGQSTKTKPKASHTLKEGAELYWHGRKDVSAPYRELALRGIELNALDAKGRHVYVRRVRVWAGQVFDWGIEQKQCDTNPAAAINPKRAFGVAKTKGHAALKLSEIPALWAGLRLEGELNSVLAAMFLAYTWTRTQETRMLEWDELDGSLWTIPEGKMKRRKEHLVPLPRQAVAILGMMKARARGSKYVFHAEHRLDRPMSDSTVLMLLYRLGYKGRMTGHGFRSVGSTWANELGYNKDAIERQLAHTPDDRVRSAYNRAEYLPDRTAMLQAWADWLDDIDAGSPEGGQSPAGRLAA
jgi:integrase